MPFTLNLYAQHEASSEHMCYLPPGKFGYRPGVMRAFSLSVQREGYSKYCNTHMALSVRGLYVSK